MVHEKIKGKHLRSLFHGKIKEETYLNKVLKKNGWKLKPEILKEMIQQNLAETKNTREVIKRLKAEGFKLGLLSVHSKERADFCEDRFTHRKLFRSTSYSFEVGVSRPGKEAYKTILEKLNAEPQSCLLIDDNLRNLQAAGSLGVQTILFTTPKHLEEDLVDLGLLAQVQPTRQKRSIRQYLRTPSLS